MRKTDTGPEGAYKLLCTTDVKDIMTHMRRHLSLSESKGFEGLDSDFDNERYRALKSTWFLSFG